MAGTSNDNLRNSVHSSGWPEAAPTTERMPERMANRTGAGGRVASRRWPTHVRVGAALAAGAVPVALGAWLAPWWPAAWGAQSLWPTLAVVSAGLTYATLRKTLLQPLSTVALRTGLLADPDAASASQSRDQVALLNQQMSQAHERLRMLEGALEAGHSELRRLAMADQLTGLPNRRLFGELFDHARATALRQRHPMALLYIDLDHFKQVNDTLGHPAGDELLLCISQRLRDAVRESDLLCRLGGDEFAVLLTPVAGVELLAQAALRLIHAVEVPVPLGQHGASASVSASVGIACFPRDGDTLELLLQRADQAMYQAKAAGRSRFAIYRPTAADDDAGTPLSGDMRLHWQPVIDTRTGQAVSAEALMRWQHPREGLLPPARFLGKVEAAGDMPKLGRQTLDEACAQMARWKASHHSPAQVSVNVSASQLRDPGWAQALDDSLRKHGLLAGELAVELTESSLMDDAETVMPQIDAMHTLGVSLMVDDFGTGPMSLARLQQLRPTRLKIDASFVQRLPGDPRALAMIDGIVRLARSLDIGVVAEGVETAAQRDALHGLGCHHQQGYLFGAPRAPLDEPDWPVGPSSNKPSTRPIAH